MRTLTAYLDEKWNQPGLNEYYLMQICQKVCQILSTKPQNIHVDHFKLPFSKATKSPKATVADKREEAHQRFLARKAALEKSGAE